MIHAAKSDLAAQTRRRMVHIRERELELVVRQANQCGVVFALLGGTAGNSLFEGYHTNGVRLVMALVGKCDGVLCADVLVIFLVCWLGLDAVLDGCVIEPVPTAPVLLSGSNPTASELFRNLRAAARPLVFGAPRHVRSAACAARAR